jgi:L,D-peptidoglycan transpeptidase YkuD (ErfK/YbiS/YcfS/YnhG family)
MEPRQPGDSARSGSGGAPIGALGQKPTLPVQLIGPDIAWCENPADRRYNRPFRRSANEPGDRLWRDDGLYDLLVEIDHNTRPRVAGRGSAVFLHVARPDRRPTAECVAMGAGDLRRLLAFTSPRTEIKIQY